MGRSALLEEAIGIGRRRRFRTVATRAANPRATGGDSVLGGLSTDGDDAPTLVAIDDAQWCGDEDLRELLAIAPRIDRAPVLILVAVRGGEPATSELLAALAGEPNAETMRLGPLAEEGVADLLERELGAPVERSVAAECRAWTGGVPGLVVAVAEGVKASGEAPNAVTLRALGSCLPPTLGRSLEARLGRLGPDAAALASAAALLGPNADLALAAKLAGLGDAEARAAADRLIAAAILSPELPLQISPPLLGAVLYESIPSVRRAGEHRRAARLIEEWGAPADEVAAHLLRADPAADPTSFATLRAAAARELSRGRPGDAADLLRRALAEPPPRAERFATLVELARAEDSASRADLGEEHLREALLLAPDEDERLKVAGALSLLQTRRGRLEDAADTVRRELGAASAVGADPDTLLELEVQLCVTLQLGAVDSGAEVDARLERLAPRLMNAASAVERAGLATLGFRRMARAEPAAEAVAPALRALEAGLLDDPGGESGPVGLAIGVLVHAEALPQAELWLGRTLARARERGADFAVGQGSFLSALFAYHRGDLAGADALAAASEAASRAYDTPWADSILLAVATDVRAARGEGAAALAVLAERGLEGDLPPQAPFTTLLESRGRLRLLAGDVARGRADLRAAGEGFEPAGIACPGYTGWRWRSRSTGSRSQRAPAIWSRRSSTWRGGSASPGRSGSRCAPSA
jgi:hypothetical protein